MKFLYPFIALAMVIGGFFFFVKPHYAQVKVLQVERAEYKATLDQVTEAQNKRNELVAKLNSFSSADIARLEKLLPDSVDTIRLIVNINEFAASRKVDIKDVRVQKANQTAPTKADKSGPPLSTVGVSFGVRLDYDDFVDFVKGLEKSLTLFDVASIGFKPDDKGGQYDHIVTIRTYYLK